MRRGAMSVLGAVGLLCAPMGCAQDRTPAGQGETEGAGTPRVIAEVNGVPLYEPFYTQTLEFLRERTRDGDVERYLAARVQALDVIIDDELLYQEAQRRGVRATDEEVDGAYRQAEEGAGGAERFLARLRGQGLDLRLARESMLKRLTIDRFVREHLAAGMAASDEEALAYYNGHLDRFTPELWVKADEILIRCGRDASTEEDRSARDRAAKILANLRAGEAFERMAHEFSEDESAARGGSLGFLRRGFAPPEFDAVAFSIATGAISDLVRTDTGYHIIRVTERRGGTPKPFDEVKEQCREGAVAAKQNAAVRVVVDRLRASAVLRTEDMVEE